MPKRKQPETSIEAYRALTPETLTKHYSKILKALSELKIANYDQISTHVGWADKSTVSRRMKEMVKAGLIKNTGSKTLTSRNRQAFQYMLVNENMTTPPPVERALKNETTAADYANMIIAGRRKKFIQKELF